MKIVRLSKDSNLTRIEKTFNWFRFSGRGPAGIDGATGATGADGEGVPVGGTAGQQLAKIDGDDFNTQWVDVSGGIDYANPISIIGTDTATIGKHHVCSGTTTDYTLTLPPVAGNAGKLISVEMSVALTRLVTLDGDGAETIDGTLTRIMWARETATLLCDGVKWTKLEGKSIPFEYSAERSTVQSITPATTTAIPMNNLIRVSVASMAHASGYFVAPRPSQYIISAMISYELLGIPDPGKEMYCDIGINAVGGLTTNPAFLSMLPSSSAGNATFGHPAVSATRCLLGAGDTVSVSAFHTLVAAANTRVVAVVRPFLVVTEVPTW